MYEDALAAFSSSERVGLGFRAGMEKKMETTIMGDIGTTSVYPYGSGTSNDCCPTWALGICWPRNRGARNGCRW